jgi:hypothetical protein
MTYQAKANFTAATAVISIAGNTVGALQSIKVDDNYNTIRVGQIGTPIDIAHIPGRVQVNISARRMVINQDLVMSFLRPIVTDKTSISTTAQTTAVGGAVIPAVAVNTVSGLIQTEAYSKADNANINNKHFYLNFYFDIIVKDHNDREIYKIYDCSVVSRSFSIDQGSIVISEDVTMFGRYVDYDSTDGSALDNMNA